MGRSHLHQRASLPLRATIPLTAAVGLLALFASASAGATSISSDAEVRVRVESLAVHGALPDHLRDALRAGLRDALTRASLDVVDDADARIVRADVAVNGTDLDLAVELVDPRSSKVLARVEGQCDMCGAAEATELIASLGTALSRRVQLQTQAPPQLRVVSDPPGATVMLDGTEIGVTPIEIPASSGAHALRISHRGHIDQTRTIDLVDGVTESVAVTLVAAKTTGPERRPVRWALGWAAGGTGALGTIVGTALIGINGRPIRSKCTGSNVDADGTCRWNHSTMVPGVVIGTLGVGLLATGVSLLIIEKRRTIRPGLRALLERTPAFARARALARR